MPADVEKRTETTDCAILRLLRSYESQGHAGLRSDIANKLVKMLSSEEGGPYPEP